MDRKTILENYTVAKNKYSDISFHLPKLLEYAYKCNHITEMGVRYVESTWAFLLASIDTGSIVVSYDIETSDQVKELKAAHPSWKFIEGDTGKVTISTTDFLFIDTLHTYDHLKRNWNCMLIRWLSIFFFTTSIASGFIQKMEAVRDFCLL